MSDVTVEVDESPQDNPPAVVVVTPESNSEMMPAWAGQLIERITRLEQNVTVVAAITDEIAETVESAVTAADIALAASDTAIELAIETAEAVDEVAEIAVATADETGVLPEVIETVETTDRVPDIVPQKTHPMFRSWSDWRGEIGG